MKYIRTKDGRLLNYEKLNEISKLSISMDAMEKNCDFRIGDTIAELCDGFVIVGKKKNKIKEITKVIYSKRQLINNIIYGAFWTIGEHDEPILKSVAKMNDKGELELL